MTETQNRVHAGVPTGGQFAATAHSDNVPVLGGITVDHAVDPSRPTKSYVITQDEDGELHYDDPDSDYAMQHREPANRSEARRALSCPRLAGRQGRVVDLGDMPGRRASLNDDVYDVVGPESGAPLVVRIRTGFHHLRVLSGNVHIEVDHCWGGSTDVHGGTADITVNGRNKYTVETHGEGKARVAMSVDSKARVYAHGTSAVYVTGGGDRCSLTAYKGATINQDGAEEDRLPVRRPDAVRTAKELQPGDVFAYRRDDVDYIVELLRAPEPHTDITGLPVLKMWSRIGDREGWMILGPEAQAPKVEL